MLVLVAVGALQGSLRVDIDADSGLNPRDGGATPARRRANACCYPPRAPARGRCAAAAG